MGKRDIEHEQSTAKATNPPAEAAEAAAAGLLYVSDCDPGIRRLRCGRGFRYRDADGATVRDAATLERIRALAIPPAYRDVWICVSPRGHLQATGRDARGRKQYRYHPGWRSCRDAGKFERLPAFADALPRLRRALRTDLAEPGFPRDKVLALVVLTLSATLLRVGNDAYARENGSYGLTTLRSRHARFPQGGLRLRFTGKGGKQHDVGIDDRRLARLLRSMHQLPGQRLFQYRDDEGTLCPVDSSMVNTYLQQRMGAAFTAKDFRTWGATLAAFQLLAAIPPPADASERAIAGLQQQVVGDVASRLGNTATVCRKSYIDPCVFTGWQDGRLARAAARARGPRQWETAARRFLARAHREAGAAGRRPVTPRQRTRG
jgi:DNA topoisomerase-1